MPKSQITAKQLKILIAWIEGRSQIDLIDLHDIARAAGKEIVRLQALVKQLQKELAAMPMPVPVFKPLTEKKPARKIQKRRW